MTTGFNTTWILFVLIFLAANLPWFSNKLFYVVSVKHAPKNLGWCLFELVLLYFMVGAVAMYAEFATYGQIAHQGWEFYATTACLFLVFAFPGFVYKALWK
jgi:Na+(H+)/acetate symporter ActP